nr:hypothetical protein CFP56_08340 [Quercus suber]
MVTQHQGGRDWRCRWWVTEIGACLGCWQRYDVGGSKVDRLFANPNSLSLSQIFVFDDRFATLNCNFRFALSLSLCIQLGNRSRFSRGLLFANPNSLSLSQIFVFDDRFATLNCNFRFALSLSLCIQLGNRSRFSRGLDGSII